MYFKMVCIAIMYIRYLIGVSMFVLVLKKYLSTRKRNEKKNMNEKSSNCTLEFENDDVRY